MVRGLFAGAVFCMEESERGRWESEVTVVNETLKWKQEGAEEQFISHGRSQNTAFSSEESQKKQLLLPREGYLCQPAPMHLVFVTNQKPINIAE